MVSTLMWGHAKGTQRSRTKLVVGTKWDPRGWRPELGVEIVPSSMDEARDRCQDVSVSIGAMRSTHEIQALKGFCTLTARFGTLASLATHQK